MRTHERKDAKRELVAEWLQTRRYLTDRRVSLSSAALGRIHSRYVRILTPDEELLLAEIPDQKPLGLVHTSEDARAARHLDVVFQVEITNANTAEALHKKTIVERGSWRIPTLYGGP